MESVHKASPALSKALCTSRDDSSEDKYSHQGIISRKAGLEVGHGPIFTLYFQTISDKKHCLQQKSEIQVV